MEIPDISIPNIYIPNVPEPYNPHYFQIAKPPILMLGLYLSTS